MKITGGWSKLQGPGRPGNRAGTHAENESRSCFLINGTDQRHGKQKEIKLKCRVVDTGQGQDAQKDQSPKAMRCI